MKLLVPPSLRCAGRRSCTKSAPPDSLLPREFIPFFVFSRRTIFSFSRRREHIQEFAHRVEPSKANFSLVEPGTCSNFLCSRFHFF